MKEIKLIESVSDLNRRDFVKKISLGATALGLGPLVSSSASAAPIAAGGKKLKVGVIGIGNRGSGALEDIINADPNTVIWSVGDIFEERLNGFRSRKAGYNGRVDTGDKGQREFLGFDAYQKVIDSGVDIVLLTSTPAFRPLHFKAAVDAGKHVFLEKPIALDIPGLKSVIESAKKAQIQGQAVLTGLVWRYTPHLMEMHKRIQDGAIGDVISTSSSYCGGGRPYPMPDMKYKPASMSDMEWSLRSWQSFVELGGDGPLEFMIHGIDRMAWAMGDAIPEYCFASGNNTFPLIGANAWDSFSMRFEYADGRVANFFGRQIPGTFAATGDRIDGTKGRAIAGSDTAVITADGKEIWRGNGPLGYVNEHKILTSHIREGKPFNDVIDKLANSHATAILGRTAAYTGQLITGPQQMSSQDEFIKNVKDLNFDTPFEARPSALPGVTKFL